MLMQSAGVSATIVGCRIICVCVCVCRLENVCVHEPVSKSQTTMRRFVHREQTMVVVVVVDDDCDCDCASPSACPPHSTGH